MKKMGIGLGKWRGLSVRGKVWKGLCSEGGLRFYEVKRKDGGRDLLWKRAAGLHYK